MSVRELVRSQLAEKNMMLLPLREYSHLRLVNQEQQAKTVVKVEEAV